MRGCVPVELVGKGQLVVAGADPNGRNPGGETLLHLAVQNSVDPATIGALLDAGADPSVPDASGKLPWDHVKYSLELRGTDVYRRLRQARR